MQADLFQKVHFSDHIITIDQDSPHVIGTDGKQMWATGGWKAQILKAKTSALQKSKDTGQ